MSALPAPAPAEGTADQVVAHGVVPVRTGVVRDGAVLLDPGPPLPEGARVRVAADEGTGAGEPLSDTLPGFGAWRDHAAEVDAFLEETERQRRLPRGGLASGQQGD